MPKNFFEEFAKNDFFEKKASENENIKSTLESITPSVLEKLAEEIGAISEEEDMTLEQKIAAESDNETDDEQPSEEPKEEKDDEPSEEDTEEEQEAESKKAKEKKEAECDSKDEEDKEAESENDNSEQEAESENNDEEQEAKEKKEAKCDSKDEEDKEAECDSKDDKEDNEAEPETENEDEVKKAYEIAEQKLASAGYTIADYVYEKTASESTAIFVSENAEKLASLSDKTTLQVADEILSAMAEKLG